MLTVVDVFTRECMALEGRTSFRGAHVAAVLSRLRSTRGLEGSSLLLTPGPGLGYTDSASCAGAQDLFPGGSGEESLVVLSEQG